MDMPLRVRINKDGGLKYSIAFWYRAFLIAIVFILISTFFIQRESPSLLGYLFIGISLIAVFYEESWTASTSTKTIRHRYGLLFASKTIEIPFERISAFQVVHFIKGRMYEFTKNESEENSASGLPRIRHSFFMKPLHKFVINAVEGEIIVINICGERGKEKLEKTALLFSEYCGIPMGEFAGAARKAQKVDGNL
jgi:hypothetical protein